MQRILAYALVIAIGAAAAYAAARLTATIDLELAPVVFFLCWAVCICVGWKHAKKWDDARRVAEEIRTGKPAAPVSIKVLQKRILLIGLIALVLMWFYPPWIHSGRNIESPGMFGDGIPFKYTPKPRHRTGYFLLFDQNQGEEPRLFGTGIVTQIDSSRLVIQSLIVVALTLGSALAVSTFRKPSTS